MNKMWTQYVWSIQNIDERETEACASLVWNNNGYRVAPGADKSDIDVTSNPWKGKTTLYRSASTQLVICTNGIFPQQYTYFFPSSDFLYLVQYST